MNIKKLGSSLAATTVLLGLSTVAMADHTYPDTCQKLFDDIKTLSTELRCGDVTLGGYPAGNPLWQKKGKSELGCEVHESLANKLYFERDPDGTKPPIKKGGNANGGVAQDLLNGKVDAAVTKLLSFLNDVESSKDNPFWDATVEGSEPESYFTDEVNYLMGFVGLCY